MWKVIAIEKGFLIEIGIEWNRDPQKCQQTKWIIRKMWSGTWSKVPLPETLLVYPRSLGRPCTGEQCIWSPLAVLALHQEWRPPTVPPETARPLGCRSPSTSTSNRNAPPQCHHLRHGRATMETCTLNQFTSPASETSRKNQTTLTSHDPTVNFIACCCRHSNRRDRIAMPWEPCPGTRGRPAAVSRVADPAPNRWSCWTRRWSSIVIMTV